VNGAIRNGPFAKQSEFQSSIDRSLFMKFPIILGLAAAILATPAFAQTQTTAEKYAEWYLYQCQLITTNQRLACFDLLPYRIPGYKGHAFDSAPAPKK
jgi:hypothetical protein